MRNVYIYDTVRTPRGKGKKTGTLHPVRPIHLAQTVLQAIKTRNDLDTRLVQDIILGCVTQIGEQGGCIAKAAALYADYHESVSGVTLNRFCGSGLESINQATTAIMAGYFDLMLAGGVESMSRVPMGSDGGAWMIDPHVADKTHFIPQGISADLIATLNGFSRRDVDGFAVESQQKAAQAQADQRFKHSIVPVLDELGDVILAEDEFPRPETNLEGLGELKPSFELMGTKYGFDNVALDKYPAVERINHVHHAGNSSGIVDGAAVALIGSEEAGKKAGLKARGKIVGIGLTATEPTIMLTGPAPASEKALKSAGLTWKDIDLVEINEAFASVCMHFIKQTGVDPKIVNVNGGAIAFGHPLGATGAMLLGTALDELERTDKKRALITLCIGGGMGIATVIERV